MQNIQIDRKKSAEIDDWAADKEPGDRIRLYGTIKSLDDQTIGVTIDEVGDGDDDDEDDDEAELEAGNEGSDAAPVGSPPGSLAALDDEGAPN